MLLVIALLACGDAVPDAPPPGTAAARASQAAALGGFPATRRIAVDVQGALDAAAVEETLDALAPDLHQCWNPYAKKDPTLGGRVRLTLTVDARGQVEQVEAEPSGRLPSGLGDCLVDAFGPFDSGSGPGTVTVELQHLARWVPGEDAPR